MHVYLNSPCFFCCEKFPSENPMYLSISTSDTGTKSEFYGIMWHVAPESKIQLVSSELSPKSLLGIFTLEVICAIEVYIFWDSFYYVLFPYALSILSIFTKKLACPCSRKLNLFIFQVRKICDLVIFLIKIWSTYLAFYCYVQYVYFGVAWIERWTEFLISLSFYLFFLTLFSWVWSYTITVLWVITICCLCSSY